ncbi:MAG: ATP synthase subunit I [bacterium]
MSSLPVWFWGAVGGVILGPIGLWIIWPACSSNNSSPQRLLKRFVVAFLVKLLLVGIGLVVAVKVLHLQPKPLVLGFLGGYLISLFLEIIPCIWKLRQWTKDTSGTVL